jgi:DNA processing protein
MGDREMLRGYLRFWLADGIGAILFDRIVDAFGDICAAIDAGPSGWKRIEGIGPEKVRALEGITDSMIDDEIAEAGKRGVDIICRDDEGYPSSLLRIYDPPPVLYVKGGLEPADAISLSIVGSRRCTHYGLEQASRFGMLLGRAGFTVVSGGARGIDTASHRGAVDGGGRTVVVMGCGLCRNYPRENRELFARIVTEGRGALLSELPMRTEVRSGNFPKRNRIIAGMSLGTLVVEAALRSGAMITARMALEQNRDVFALPGRVDSPQSRGTHRLLREGAHVVTELEDILAPLGEVGQRFLEDEGEDEDPGRPCARVSMNAGEQGLYDALAEGPMGMDELVAASGLDAGEVAASMTMLVLKGAVEQKPGNIFGRKRI